MRTSKPNAPYLQITCLSGERCTVHVEPWGTEHILERDEIFYVYSAAIGTGSVEVSYVHDGIALGFSSDAEVLILNREGERLEI